MNEKTTNGLLVQLRQDTDVYQLRDESLIFKRGTKVLKVESKTLLKNPKKFTKSIEGKTSLTKLKTISGIRKRADFEALVSGLINGGFLKTSRHTDMADTNEFWEPFSCGDVYTVETIYKALKDFSVNIYGPNIFVEYVTELLSKYSIVSQPFELCISDDNHLLLRIPHEESHISALHIIYLSDISILHRKDLAYALVRKNIDWLPIHSDEENSFVVGPSVVKSGPCFYCHEMRQQANMAHPEVVNMITSKNTIQLKKMKSKLSPLDMSLMSSTIVAMVIRYILGSHQDMSSRKAVFYRINTKMPTIETCSLYKNPYCEVCSPALIIPGEQDLSSRRS